MGEEVVVLSGLEHEIVGDDLVLGIIARGLPVLDQGHEHTAGDVPGVRQLAGNALGLVLLVELHHGRHDGLGSLLERLWWGDISFDGQDIHVYGDNLPSLVATTLRSERAGWAWSSSRAAPHNWRPDRKRIVRGRGRVGFLDYGEGQVWQTEGSLSPQTDRLREEEKSKWQRRQIINFKGASGPQRQGCQCLPWRSTGESSIVPPSRQAAGWANQRAARQR